MPIENPVLVDGLRPRKHQPSDHDGGEPEGHRDPEHPMPSQCAEHEAAYRRTRAHPDCLGRREKPQRAAPAVLIHRLHEDRNAVRTEQRAPNSLKNAKHDEPGEIGRKTAQCARRDEQSIARPGIAISCRTSRIAARRSAGMTRKQRGRPATPTMVVTRTILAYTVGCLAASRHRPGPVAERLGRQRTHHDVNRCYLYA